MKQCRGIVSAPPALRSKVASNMEGGMAMNKFLSLVGGVILGGLVSAATVLLFTPKSGDAVRADIKHEVDAILEEGRRASEVRRNELEAQLNQMRGDAMKPDGKKP